MTRPERLACLRRTHRRQLDAGPQLDGPTWPLILLIVCGTEPEEVDDHERQHRQPRDGQVQLTIQQSRVQLRSQVRFTSANMWILRDVGLETKFWWYSVSLKKQHMCMETTHKNVSWIWNRRSFSFWSASNMTCACRFTPLLNAVSEIPSTTCHLRAPARTLSKRQCE